MSSKKVAMGLPEYLSIVGLYHLTGKSPAELTMHLHDVPKQIQTMENKEVVVYKTREALIAVGGVYLFENGHTIRRVV